MTLTRRQWFLGVALAVVVGLVAATRLAARSAARSTDRLVSDLLAMVDRRPADHIDTDQFSALPDPVRRYFETVLPDEPRPIRTVRLEQRGEFQTGEGEDGWKPFTATQRFTTDPPGFVWAADIEMAPLVDAHVVDAYVGGEGSLHATVFGAPVVDMGSSPEMDEGELLRYLAEAVWFPTALLPSAGVEWEELDDDAARATLTDGDVTATLTFRFGRDGLVERVYGQRYRQETDDHALWAGYFDEYERRNGLLVPTEAEVEWQLPDRDVPYWRGTVTDIDHEMAEAPVAHSSAASPQ